MILYKDPKFKREKIMEHYSKPIHKKILLKKDFSHFSNHCVDELHIKWKFSGDNKLIKASWNGKGCAIFQASTDIFLNLSLNKTKKEILKITNEYEKMLNNQKYDEELLLELNIFNNVKKQLNRLECANMISQAILKNIK